MTSNPNGILLIDKAKGDTSFRLVSLLRKRTHIEKIGHCGTLDPFATGLMVMLIGREYTKRSDEFLTCDKEYEATMHLGIATDSHDIEGAVTSTSPIVPKFADIEAILPSFQGDILQTPPMFSAKKVQGKKLYELARKGISIERQPVNVHVQITILSYNYPELKIHVACSKGTYIRSLAHDIGNALGTFAHLSALRRTRSGDFKLEDAIVQEKISDTSFDLTPFIRGL
jgi:tRNA pseudouridine55 synthase